MDARADDRLKSLGRHALRGVKERKELFAADAEQARAGGSAPAPI